MQKRQYVRLIERTHGAVGKKPHLGYRPRAAEYG